MQTTLGPKALFSLWRAVGLSAGLGGVLASQPAMAAADGWEFTPTVGVEQIYSSNTTGNPTGYKPDLITQFSTGIHVVGETPHATIDFNYSPTFSHYDMGTSQDRVDHNEIATGRLSPLPGHFVIDFSTFAIDMGGRANTISGVGQSVAQTDDRLLYFIGNVAPHFSERFGDVATVDAWYRLKSANTSDESAIPQGSRSRSGNSLSKDAAAIIGSGETLGRLGASLNFDHSNGGGSGENAQSSSDSDFLGLEYHLTHAISLNGSLGYQRTHYDKTLESAPYTNEGLTWNAGASYTPTPKIMLSVSYGLQQGLYAPTLRLTYALGPLTTLTASYVTKIETQLQSIADNLQFLGFNPAGQPIDTRTGLPFVGINPIFGSQNALFRDKPLSISLNHQFVRSGITASLTYETRNSVTGLPAKDVAYGGSISYSRELTPLLNGYLEFEYTDHKSTGVVSQGNDHAQLINASFWLEYKLSETASARLGGNYLQRISNIPVENSKMIQITLGAKKDF